MLYHLMFSVDSVGCGHGCGHCPSPQDALVVQEELFRQDVYNLLTVKVAQLAPDKVDFKGVCADWQSLQGIGLLDEGQQSAHFAGSNVWEMR